MIVLEIQVFRGFRGRGPGPDRGPGGWLDHPRGGAAGDHRQAEKAGGPDDHPDGDANGTLPHELTTPLVRIAEAPET